eukprot:scaffold2469_cov149-Skeletonema_menzelii.AAC.3
MTWFGLRSESVMGCRLMGIVEKILRGERGLFCGMGILGLFEVYSILACIDSQGFIRYYKELEEELFYQASHALLSTSFIRAEAEKMSG